MRQLRPVELRPTFTNVHAIGGRHPAWDDLRARDAPLRDYALVGDLHTGALVSASGSVDWMCLPRFDGPAVFCRLLDAARGGYLRVGPLEWARVEREYVPGTAVLRTTFEAASGALRVTDFMPVSDLAGPSAGSPRRLHRIVEAVSGSPELHVEFRPTFDFARRAATLERVAGGVVARSDGATLRLESDAQLEVRGDAAIGRETLRAGERRHITLHDGPELVSGSADADLERTVAEWERWTGECRYDGAHAEQVRRSAITLKLLTYAPTGAVVAAPTTSLPERAGGERNWDYRYSWIRDSALAVGSLIDLGYHDDAMRYWSFIERLGIDRRSSMHIAYALDGREVPAEEQVPDLAGWQRSRPIRLGNSAASQRQLDVAGYVLDAAEACQAAMGTPHEQLAPTLAALTRRVCADWRQPDQGIWELRVPPQQLVHSKLLCWVALDRALRLQRRGIIEGDAAAWERTAAEIRRFVLERGFDHELGAFVQAVGSRHLDATALRLGVLGLIDPRDERFTSTIACVRAGLERDGLVHRYDAPDGLPGREGAFVLASFWLVEALAAAGEHAAANAVFDAVLRRANDVGLLSEEVDPETGALLGNYPQAFSHLGLIRAAVALRRGVR